MKNMTKRMALLSLSLALLAGSARSATIAIGDHWSDLGYDLPGTHGSPALLGEGHLVPGSPLTLTLSNVRAQTTAFGIVGLSAIYLPFSGGTFVPAPTLIFNFPTGGTSGTPSTVSLTGSLPDAIPIGTEIYTQFWILDPAGPQGFAASNAVLGTTRRVYDLVAEELDSMLEVAAAPSISKPIYSSQDFSNRVFVRNPTCWAAQIDLTGISPWNEYGGPRRAGTLISPRHIAFAKHYPLSTNPTHNKIVFVTNGDVTVTRALVGVTYPASDIGIGILDADVPPEISFHKVLPRDWNDDLLEVRDLPMLHLDQQEKALVRDMLRINLSSFHIESPDPLRAPFTESLIGGDSGNPAFLLIGGEALLILTHLSSGHGPCYTSWFDEVNAAMTSLGGGYQLTEFDLDGYLHD